MKKNYQKIHTPNFNHYKKLGKSIPKPKRINKKSPDKGLKLSTNKSVKI